MQKLAKEKEFEDALQRLRGHNTDISHEVAEIMETLKASKQQPQERFSDLLQRKYLYPVIVGVGLMLLQQLSGCSAMSFYASSIFEKANASSSAGTSIMAILVIPVSAVNSYLMDSCGRRPLLLVSACGTCLCCFLVGLSFYLQKLQYLPELTPALAFIGIMAYGPVFTFGMAGIPWTIMSEIFPLNVKASAGSLVTLVNWSGSWLATYAFHFMMEWSCSGTFFIFFVISALTVVFIWKLVPETKGRTLEEIQESFALVAESEL